MTTWLSTFKLKDLLNDKDVEPETAAALAKQVAHRLDLASPIFGEFHERLRVGFQLVEDQDEFNAALSDLYDAADLKRVWVK